MNRPAAQTRPKLATLKPVTALLNTSHATSLASTLDFADERRGSRQSRGYGADWDRLRPTILKRDEYLCQTCLKQQPRRYTPATHVDHIIEKVDGGDDAPTNLQSLCRPCHEAKTRASQAQRRGRT